MTKQLICGATKNFEYRRNATGVLSLAASVDLGFMPLPVQQPIIIETAGVFKHELKRFYRVSYSPNGSLDLPYLVEVAIVSEDHDERR